MAVGGNRRGVKGNKGGSLKRNHGLSVDWNPFEAYAEDIDRLGGNLQAIFTDAMEQAAETIQEDTLEAISPGNLPAGGKYSNCITAASVVQGASVTWSGTIAEIPVGFDFSKPGAGGFLITGTPRMRPDWALEDIYVRKKYMREIQEDMMQIFMDAVNDLMGG